MNFGTRRLPPLEQNPEINTALVIILPTFGGAWCGVKELAAVFVDGEVTKGTTSLFAAPTSITSFSDAPTSVEFFVPMSLAAALGLASLST